MLESIWDVMENMQYAEELLREFLVFRGFTSTLQTFETELSTDIGKGFQGDKILDLVFSVYVPKFQADRLVGLLNFFKKCFSSSSEAVLITTLSKIEVSILRYYIVHALQCGRKDKVIEFFGENGNDLLRRRDDWTPWFAIPYLKNPSLDSQFRVYFSKEWFDALRLSFGNFLSEIFNGIRIPALLKISTEKNTIKHLKNDIKQLNLKLSQLQALLETKEAELCQLRSTGLSTPEAAMLQESSSILNSSMGNYSKDLGSSRPSGNHQQTGPLISMASTLHIGELGSGGRDVSSSANISSESLVSESENDSSSVYKSPPRDDRHQKDLQTFQKAEKCLEKKNFQK